jgi:outer membrane protein OmpA-like peptidoglycan-associated protein
MALGKVEIKKAKLAFEDKTLREGGKVDISSLDATIDSLSNKADATFPFCVAASLVPGGTVTMDGKASAVPKLALEAKLTLADLPVAVAQPYLHEFAKLGIDDGKLDIEGDLTMRDPDGLKIVGQGEVRSLKLEDEVEKRPVVSWDKLSIDRYVYHQDKNEVNISQVALAAPFVRFQVAKDHSTNFGHILLPAAPAKQGSPEPQAKSLIHVTIGKIAVASGSADYGDASLPLPFATHVTNLAGHISSLSSAALSASSVSLKGQVDQYGEATVLGKVNPFQIGKGMKVTVVFRNVDFPGLSPYTVKFAGRRIAKGKLDLESQYSIDEGKLNGSNKVVISEMELGERVDAPGAMDLPLELAISLLKDDQGKINLDLPVTGDINDPQFEISGVIAKAVGDVLGDLVTAPFRALAGMFGSDDGAGLDHIDFMPGRSDLEPPEKEKIMHVAEILQKRPTLSLVVTGVVDKDADRQKLQRDALDADMAKELGDHDMIGRQRTYLEALLEKRGGKDQLAAVKQSAGGQPGDDDPAYVASLRREAAKSQPIDEAGLDRLGQARAASVADALKQVPGFDGRRVSVKGSKQVKAEDGRIALKLEAATQD